MTKKNKAQTTGDRLVILSTDNNTADVVLDGANVGACQRDKNRHWNFKDTANGQTYDAPSLYEAGRKAQHAFSAKSLSFERP